MLAPISDVDGGAEVVGQLAAGVEKWAHLVVDVSVEAHFRVFHVHAGLHLVTGVGLVGIAEGGDVEHADGLPVAARLRVVGHAAELLHVLVQVEQPAVLVVEREGEERQVGELLVFVGNLAVGAFSLLVVGDVVDGIDDIGWATLAVELQDGVALEV